MPVTSEGFLKKFTNQDYAAYVKYAADRAKDGDQFEARILASIKRYPVSMM